VTEIPLSDLRERYTALDPASGKQAGAIKRIRARSAIVTIAVDSLRRRFVLEAWAAKCPTEELVDKIFDTYDTWRPKRFGCEANAMQTVFADMLHLEAKHRRTMLPIEELYPSSKVTKEWRNRTLLRPLIMSGLLFIPKQFTELWSELEQHPRGQRCDLVDALYWANEMVPHVSHKPPEDVEADNLAAFLRSEGASPREIEHRVAIFKTQRRLDRRITRC